jgi:RNA polymerase subunit RPABC4/transcription elongation factor Spt4
MPTFKHPCPYCGKFIDRVVSACPFCGVVEPFSPKRCLNCRKIVEDPAWVVCPSCGVSLLPPPPGGAGTAGSAGAGPAGAGTAGPTPPPATQVAGAPPPPPAPMPLPVAPAPQSAGPCSGCGAPLPAGARFCTICGTMAAG